MSKSQPPGLQNLKRVAASLKPFLRITHAEALETAARLGRFESYQDALRHFKALDPTRETPAPKQFLVSDSACMRSHYRPPLSCFIITHAGSQLKDTPSAAHCSSSDDGIPKQSTAGEDGGHVAHSLDSIG